MYESAEGLRVAGRLTFPPDGEESAYRLAITRVRNLLSDCLPGMSADADRLRKGLSVRQADPASETERHLALGWLAWLEGDWAGAETLLVEGSEPGALAKGPGTLPVAHAPGSDRDVPLSPLLEPGWSAYWCARVRLLQGHADAVAEYEAALKKLGGSPWATARYVDLLWRAGRADRAEQVWKSVRANKRVTGCEEGPILEARSTLRKGEYAAGERLLNDASPRDGVLQVERHLLLAWTLASQRKGDESREALDRAAEGPYPASALADWRHFLNARLRGESIVGVAPAGWQDDIDGQDARAVGRTEEAIPRYRAALATPTVQPFAAHALWCLGERDMPMSQPPGLFFAVRARMLQAVVRFCRRESGPGQFLDALDQADRAGVEVAGFDLYRRLARHLQDRSVDLIEVPVAARRNALRLALESATRLPADEQLPLLTAWSGDDIVHEERFRHALGRQLLRLALTRRDRAVLELARPLLPADAVEGADKLFEPATDFQKLPQGSPEGVSRAIRQSVLLVEAASLGDLASVAGLVSDLDSWRPFRMAPPRFAIAALAAVAAAKPANAHWSRVLPAWLALWKPEALGESGAVLSAIGGVSAGQAPAGVDPQAWFCHQSARALLRDDAPAALAFARQAPDSQAIQPALERRALATHLSRCLCYSQPGLLVDFVDLINTQPEGPPLLEAASRSHTDEVQNLLAALGERADLPGRFLHHLALIETRLAQQHEADDPLLSTLHARRAWGAWLKLLASADAPPADSRALLVDHLLAGHRARINDHLSRDELGPARSHWQLVVQLPDLAREGVPSLVEDLSARVERFRDELATEFLLTMREAMRFGDIAEGFRSNYERGLSLLNQALALDRDNLRLLTAYAETCVDWFFDLYQLHDARLFREVDRLLEPAERLAEIVRDDESQLSARSTLAEFWKFRGFAAGEQETKAALYREALRLNPGNDNVRDLLARLEGDEDE